MYTDNFLKLSDDCQVLCMLVLSEKIKNGIVKLEDIELASKAMQDCWMWLEKKEIEGSDLYNYAECFDDDGAEFGLLFSMDWEEDPVILGILGCITTAVTYTALKAFVYEKQKYMPQALENIDEDSIEYFFDKFIMVYKDDKVILDLFNTLVENKSKDILETMEIVKRQYLQ